MGSIFWRAVRSQALQALTSASGLGFCGSFLNWASMMRQGVEPSGLAASWRGRQRPVSWVLRRSMMAATAGR